MVCISDICMYELPRVFKTIIAKTNNLNQDKKL